MIERRKLYIKEDFMTYKSGLKAPLKGDFKQGIKGDFKDNNINMNNINMNNRQTTKRKKDRQARLGNKADYPMNLLESI